MPVRRVTGLAVPVYPKWGKVGKVRSEAGAERTLYAVGSMPM